MIPDEVQLIEQISSETNGILYKMFDNISKKCTKQERRMLDQQLKFKIIACNKEKTLECSESSVLYWKNKHDIFRLLSKVAIDHLAVQATNCSSEGVNFFI